MIDLPNNLWIRSTKQPDWAICLDPDDADRYGRKCREREELQCWEARSLLRLDEVQWSLQEYDCRTHWLQFAMLLVSMLK